MMVVDFQACEFKTFRKSLGYFDTFGVLTEKFMNDNE